MEESQDGDDLLKQQIGKMSTEEVNQRFQQFVVNGKRGGGEGGGGKEWSGEEGVEWGGWSGKEGGVGIKYLNGG